MVKEGTEELKGEPALIIDHVWRVAPKCGASMTAGGHDIMAVHLQGRHAILYRISWSALMVRVLVRMVRACAAGFEYFLFDGE